MKLYEYIKKQVKITDIDGDIFYGKVEGYISAQTSPDGIASIAITPNNMPEWSGGYLICFTENDIKTIEIIEF
ncbi:MAG: hypothetical protein FWG68_12655 [Defluviitaleaceae bacterium]|nr:hypothetical protein [Defluviitaleaceae bacterium]